MFMPVDELKIGQIVEVAGTCIKVEISAKISELTRTFKGRVYPIGQIGSMVKIHYGRKIIFGLVTMLRMRSEELLEAGIPINPDADQRLMEVQLLAEGNWVNSKTQLIFKRGIKTYPLPQQGVYLLTSDEVSHLYRSAEGEIDQEDVDPLVPFAVYSASEATPCRANINKMFGMHCAILGSTGSGKSGTVAAIIHSVLSHKHGDKELSPQIIVIDPHGEYSEAFKERAILYRAYDLVSEEADDQEEIALPYWLMSSDEFTNLIIGKTEHSATSQNNVVQKALTHSRMVAAGIVNACPKNFGSDFFKKLGGIDEPSLCEGHDSSEILSFDRDKPRPFCLDEFENHVKYVQGSRLNKDIHESLPGSDLAKSPVPSVLDKLKVLRQDTRLSFMMKNWVNLDETIKLHEVLNQFVGIPQKNVKILK